MSQPTDLKLKHYGLLFQHAAVEADYRRWRNEQALPRLQIVGLVSMLCWVFIIEVEPLLAQYGIDWPDRSRWVLYGYIVPTCLFGIGLPYLPARARLLNWLRSHALLFFTASMIVVASLALLWLNLLNPHWQYYPIALVNVLVFMLWIPFARIPSWQSLLTLSALFAPLLLCLWTGWPIDNLLPADRWGTTVVIVLGGFVCQACAVTIDRDQRRSYVQKLTVQRQREDLELSQKLIRRYVPAAVADHIAAGKGEQIDAPQRRRITVMFSDIVGFTDMADRLDAESLTQVLNEYLATMANIVEQHGGTLNEFSGDGLMAVFGAPNEMAPKSQALNALRAAQAMQKQLPDLNEQWYELGIGEPLQIRIGINTGVLSVGSFGSEGRMTYTAIGLQTNIAARIQAHCEPGGVLLSDATWHLIKDQIDCEAKGEVECKGVHFPVKVYAPAPTPSLRGTK